MTSGKATLTEQCRYSHTEFLKSYRLPFRQKVNQHHCLNTVMFCFQTWYMGKEVTAA